MLAAGIYLNTLRGPYLYDDVTEIQTNPRVHRLASIPRLLTTEFWYGERGRGILYRPVTAATIPPLFILGEGSPWPLHAANVLLHALTTCLLAAIVRRLTGRGLPAVAAGALFALHPIHAEAVSWISGRSELLFASAGAAAWWFHLRAREGRRIWFTAGAVLCLAASLGSKETAVAWIPIFAVGDLLFPPAASSGEVRGDGVFSLRVRRAIRLYAAYASAAILWLMSRYLVLGQLGRRSEEGAHLLNPLEGEPWWPAVPLTCLRVLGKAVGLLAWPAGGCADYGFNQIPLARDLFQPDVLVVLVILIILAALGVRLSRTLRVGAVGPRERTLLLAAAILFLAWVPVSSLLIPSVSILAERNLYLPSFGACLALAVLYEEISERAPRADAWLLAAGTLALATMGVLTMARNTVFLDPIDLFASSASNCPDSARGHFLYGAVLMDRGLADKAAGAYQHALSISPDYTDARADLAQALSRLGRENEAREAARAAAASAPGSIETRLAVASALSAAGLRDESERIVASLRRESPDDERVLFMEAQIARATGRLDDALALFEKIRSAFPQSPAGAAGAGAVFMSRGDAKAARREFEKALGLDPYDGSALYNLGLLAMRAEPSDEASNQEAIGRFRRYLRIMPADALGWMRLGEALERAGSFEEAEDAFKTAAASAPDHPGPARALGAFRERRAGKK